MDNTSTQFKRSYSHLNSAKTILALYDGTIPFAHFIKNYFAQHKKFGSKDRKKVTALCYAYFRLGTSLSATTLSLEQKILKGIQLSNNELEPEWSAIIAASHLPELNPTNLFPCKDRLSEGIDIEAFETSHLVQPDLFLRPRPGNQKTVTDKLTAAAISFKEEGDAIRLPNNLNIEDIITLNKEAVVQDLSSQKTADFLNSIKMALADQPSEISVWDCCAASGGKSILATDVLKKIRLTVSDIRPSIISNLRKRFTAARIKNFESLVLDSSIAAPEKHFDLIIADVPCSGSGTWARTPEQLSFFTENKIDEYANLQNRIISNTVQYLKPKGYFLYITCSVFAAENEMQVNRLVESGMQLIKQSVIKGYTDKADTMFAALLQK